MTRHRLLTCLLAALVLTGCAAHRLNDLDDQLADLNHQCAASDQQHDLASCQQRYEQLAGQALADARNASADPLTRLAFYRVAATGAFDAGPLGAETVSAATNEGIQVCEKLPQQDGSAPRDCAVIRLAYPLAVAADLSRTLNQLIAQRDALRQTNPAAQLPASDLQGVLGLYDWFQTEFDKVSWIRGKLTDPGVSDQLKAYVDDQRRAIYCWALKAYSVAFDVEGTTPASLAQLTTRKTALRQRAEESLGAIDCRTAPAIAFPPK
jgi:hypothetical protein